MHRGGRAGRRCSMDRRMSCSISPHASGTDTPRPGRARTAAIAQITEHTQEPRHILWR
uniref:Uncharacterized protein n=1 Tax=Ralstonia solanacearum TaxID=305 RepID=A0A0S4WBR2_RALSL|nr:protein of unknown function [Ralstonia solanacearum]